MNPHLGECEEFPVDCPNGCGAAGETGTGKMKRGAVPLHLAECPLQKVECPYREYGCGEEMERGQLDLHEREYMHTHFRLAMKEMKRKQIESTELKDAQILEANNKINCLEKLSAVKDSEIISVNKEIKELKTLSIEMKQKQTDTNKLKDSQILEADNKIDCLEKQIANTNSESISVKMEIRELKALSSDMKQKQIQSNGKIKLLEKENRDLKNELGELKENISILVSTGQLEWKIKGVKQKIEKKENIYSDPFYVGLYKCQGSIVWDCDNTGKVGCFVHILKGKFDNKLKWPFIYRFKFVLLNQDRNEDDYIRSHEITKETLHYRTNCFKKPTEIRNEGFGTSSFISNTEILTWKYCKNDYISIHITVEQLPAF